MPDILQITPLNLSILSQQQRFAVLLAKFLMWITSQPGYACVVGEVKRPPEMQELYLATKKTQVSHSKHQDSLAVDIALFIHGKYVTDSDSYKPLGEYWKSLDPSNVWGGDWKSFHDGNHFQYGV